MAVVVLVLMTASCLGTSSVESDGSLSPQPSLELAHVEGLSGTVYLTDGVYEGKTHLFALRFDPLGYERVLEARVAGVDACEDFVVVSAAPAGSVGSHPLLVRDGRLEPIPGWGLERGMNAKVNEDCVVAFLDPASNDARPSDPMSWRLHNLRTGAPVEIDVPVESVDLAWGPAGRFALLDIAPSGERVSSGRIRLFSADGDPERELRTNLPNPRAAKWGNSEWLAVLDFKEGTELVHAAGAKPSIMVPGWLALAVSPDGKTLLLRSLEKGNRIGILEYPDAEVRVLGDLPGDNLFPGSWISAE